MGHLAAIFLLPASILLAQVTSRAVNITTSWTLPQEGFPHFFRYFKDPTTWDDAKVICGSFHAELLTVENDERRDAARAYLKELDVLENVWCGLQRSTIEAPFVWTGGGQGPVVGDAFWQQPHPLEPEHLCVAINPLYDFRWQSFPCSGPQQNSFVCQLEVPDWASGEKGCLINSLPSLTVTYLPEPGVIELLSDCGLSGTKRIACKGGESQQELMKRLSCREGDESHTTTQVWSSKGQRHDTSTPSDSINAITSQITRSSGTRHKRESGGTSTSTDTSLIIESEPSFTEVELEPIDHSIPPLEPLKPLDITTHVADVQIEKNKETPVPPIPAGRETNGQIRPPIIAQGSHGMTVKNWLQLHNDELTTTHNSFEISTLVTNSGDVVTPTINQDSTKIETTTTHYTESPAPTGFIETSSNENHTRGKQVIEGSSTTAIFRELTTILPATEKGSHMPLPPRIQLRENQYKSNVKTTNPPKLATTVTTTSVSSVVEEEMGENTLIITVVDSGLNETDNNVLPQGGPEHLLAEQEILVSKKTKMSSNNNNKLINKDVKDISSKQEETQTISSPQDYREIIKTETESFHKADSYRNVPIIVIEELNETEATETPYGETEQLNHSQLRLAGITVTTEEDTKQGTSKTTLEASTETTYTESSDAVPDQDRPLTETSPIAAVESNITSPLGKENINVTHFEVKKEDVDATAASLTNEPKDTVTDTPTQTNSDAGTVQATSTQGPDLNTEVIASADDNKEINTQVNEKTVANQVEAKEIVESVLKDVVATTLQTEDTAIEVDPTQDLPMSEESSEEAENPKRTSRGRLFQHSNPLSFYPYFLNRVLG